MNLPLHDIAHLCRRFIAVILTEKNTALQKIADETVEAAQVVPSLGCDRHIADNTIQLLPVLLTELCDLLQDLFFNIDLYQDSVRLLKDLISLWFRMSRIGIRSGLCEMEPATSPLLSNTASQVPIPLGTASIYSVLTCCRFNRSMTSCPRAE